MVFRIFRKKPESITRNQLEAWLKNLSIEADSVADVGGRKLPVKSRVGSWKVQRYDILDLPEYDLNQVWGVAETYTVVFCLEVFEYLYNPLQAMKNLFQLLKPNGVLYASFHFIYPHHGPRECDFLRYTQWGVDKLLGEAGFSSWEKWGRPFGRPQALAHLFSGEKMKGIDTFQAPIHEDQGYLVRAIK
jgi:SAM-dependent methyltransferase